jgi:hypothetical protein
MRSRLTFFAVGIALLLGSGQTARSSPGRTLSLAERAAYQYAIEEIYWRHRIWPKGNPSPKPPLDQATSRAQIENKVQDYLHKSQMVAKQRDWPITSSELQAEMDRMAYHTKQPDVLRELFAALGNEPFVIAECLARPILAERLATNLAVVAGVSPASTSLAAADTAASTGENNPQYKLPEISAPLDCADDTWTPTTTVNAPDARGGHTAVWTGSEMIIWGGYDNGGDLNNGSRYTPSTDSWVAITNTSAPDARYHHTAMWTGSEMIVWGGNGYLNSGGRYNPTTDSWIATSTANAPERRESHAAVWSGSEMIIWGGGNTLGVYLNSGGRYNPSTDNWVATSTISAPAGRGGHRTVWSGNEMIVWGGYNGSYLGSGGRYNPSTDSWVATSITNAPSGRSAHTAVWTGNEMIVWLQHRREI